MVTERLIICGSSPPEQHTGRPLRLSLSGPDRNLNLEIDTISSVMVDKVPAAFVDLLEIATYVYCADQALRRGGDDVDLVGANWRRRMRFRIPVRQPDLWNSASMKAVLASTLEFLSEDNYEFGFSPFDSAAPLQQYLSATAPIDVSSINEVALFSGGLDSLGGAITEVLLDRRHVALVTHQPTPKFAKRQRAIISRLTDRAKSKPLFVPVTINKRKALSTEHTQRSRSFLYVALAATVANMLSLSRVRFYENGIVSLNLPPSPQVIGAKATRTTHPRVLDGFAKILTAVAGRRFEVENPFLWRTKTEVVEGIVAAGCSDLIALSTSCMHTWEMTNEHPHCGSCSQCIDRRFAVLAAGAEEHDPGDGYKVDLLTGARADDEPRTLLSAYVETARSIASMSVQDFLPQFGEVYRALPYLGGTADSAALRVFELHKRHSRHVTRVVEGALVKHAAAILNRSLPPSCLLRLVCDTGDQNAGDPSKSSAPATLAENSFVRNGKAWLVRYSGSEAFVLLPTAGANYLHILLSNPTKAHPAAELAAMVNDVSVQVYIGNSGDSTDKESLQSVGRRMRELTGDVADAKKARDTVAADIAQAELDELEREVRRHVDKDGKPRRSNDDLDRVRKAVCNAVRRTLREIRAVSPALADHLAKPQLDLGSRLCYTPPDGVVWLT